MISNKHKGDFMCRELAALNNEVGGAEHVQWILLSSVKASLYGLCAASMRLQFPIIIKIIIISYSYYTSGAEQGISDPVSSYSL